MKFRVTMKDPDAIHDAVTAAVAAEVAKLALPREEADVLREMRTEAAHGVCDTWFGLGEYLTVEVDTEAQTCTVVPAGEV